MPNFLIITFGCQMNRHDSDVLAGELLSRGFTSVRDIEQADLVVFNTCAVRAHAEDKLYSHLGAIKAACKKNQRLRVGVMGCVAQKDGEALIRRFPHLSFVLGTQEMGRLCEIAGKMLAEDVSGPIVETTLTEETHPLPLPSHAARLTRHWSAQVAVMRGCNNFCSYCVVPLVQGREVSRPVADVLEDAKRLSGRGVTEIILLGQNVDSYGRGLEGNPDLASLIECVAHVPGLRRISFVTNHPRDMSRRLIEAVAVNKNVAPYFHIPPQAGNNRILELMNRGYTKERYLELVRQIRSIIPDAEIAGDFIAGFPSETSEDFEDTLDLARKARLASAFIFKYSPRPGTRAAEMPDDVSGREKSRRHKALTELQHSISLEENQRRIGKEAEVLVEGKSSRKADRQTGRTSGNRIVIMPSGTGKPGEYVTVRIASATALALYAEGACIE
jgi:tRNA-2-methylthio-N6-dimethylallyladenosine synthase